MTDGDTVASMRSNSMKLGDEEILNFLTHGGGFVLALGGACVLFSSLSTLPGGALYFSCCIYAATLVALYAASALSHSHPLVGPDRRSFFRSLDQGVIFLFIAANFTPCAIAHLPAATCWLVVGVMWTFAVAGFFSKVFWRHRVESISIAHYLVLGWTPIFVIGPILRSLPLDGIIWFVGGGLCYTIGTVFLALDGRVRYFHAYWHLLVIAGSCCHFFVVLDYVIPRSS